MKGFKLVCVLALASTTLVAAPQTASANGFPQAGCGLGAMLIGSQPGFTQVFAATTNAFFGNQTFGISSGTLGCGTAPAAGIASAKAYVETNRQAFAKDVARGQGETIANLSQLGGCADANALAAKLQVSFKTVFPSATATDAQVSASAVNLLKGDASLKCAKLI